MRAELLGQIVGAQFDLERAIAELTRSGASAGTAQNQLQALAKLQRQIGDAGGTALASLRAEIAATVSESRAIVQQGANAARGAEAAEIEALATASAAARATAQSFAHDFYERKIFDPYLRFSSAEDEAEYRKREEANRKAIDAALAEGTPEGTLRAIRLEQAQLRDAGAHGADRSPDYAGTQDRLAHTEASLNEAIHVASKARPASPPSAAHDTAAGDDLTAVFAALKNAGVSTPLASDPSLVADASTTLRAQRSKDAVARS